MRLITNYMTDASLRGELNELTREIYGFDFENWVRNGYFDGAYIPYSLEQDGKILSNVSVNLMNFVQNGKEKRYIQLGTVMTAKEHRKKGYARKLAEQAIADYKEKADGIYLFANLDALGFYEKIGFTRGMQYRYTRLRGKAPSIRRTGREFEPIDVRDGAKEEQRKGYLAAIRASAVNSAFEHTNKFGLQTFYTADLENVYYCDELNCYAVMELEDNTMYLQSIICGDRIGLREIICRLPFDYEELVLGFTPCIEDQALFEAEPFGGGNDYVFYYMGKELENIGKERLIFPELSHA